MKNIKLTIAPGGEYSLNPPQFNWTQDNDSLQTCLVAGQKMMAIQKSDDEPTVFELHYLNFMATGFSGLEDAKDNASEFARNVLASMDSLISRNVDHAQLNELERDYSNEFVNDLSAVFKQYDVFLDVYDEYDGHDSLCGKRVEIKSRDEYQEPRKKIYLDDIEQLANDVNSYLYRKDY